MKLVASIARRSLPSADLNSTPVQLLPDLIGAGWSTRQSKKDISDQKQH